MTTSISHHYKLLCLIIASKDAQYPEFEQQWRKYIDKIGQSGIHPNIQFFFLYCDNETTIDPETHTITIQGEESLIPGIFNKTIHAMMETIQIDYDYLLRTNLSSFFDFPKLLTYLERQSPTNYIGAYTGVHEQTIFMSGAGYIISKDIVAKTINKYTCMTPQELSYIITLPDDVAISLLIKTFYDLQNTNILPRFAPQNKITLLDIPPEVFHVRLKTPHIYGGSRQIDIENMAQLVNDIMMN